MLPWSPKGVWVDVHLVSEGSLGGCPHGGLAVFDLRHRGVGFDGSVGDVAVVIGGLEGLGRCSVASLQISFPFRSVRVGCRVHQVLKDAFRVHRGSGFVELGFDSPQGPLSQFRIGRQNGHQPVFIHDRHPRHGLSTGGLHLGHGRAMRRWAENAGIKHPRKPNVAGIFGVPGHLLHAVHP